MSTLPLHHAVAEMLLTRLQARGVVFIVEAGQLHYEAPPGALTRDLLDALRDHKVAIVSLLAAQTTAQALLQSVSAQGGVATLHKGRVRVQSPHPLPDGTYAAINVHREAIAQLLREGWGASETLMPVTSD